MDINFGVDETSPRLVFDEIGSRQELSAASLKMLVEAGLLSPDVLAQNVVRQTFGIPLAQDTAGSLSSPAAPTTPAVAPAAGRRRATPPTQQGVLF